MSTTERENRVSSTYDHRDQESSENPYERWKAIRDEAGIGYSELYGGFHVVTRHADVCEVARNAETFSSAYTTIPELASPPFPPINNDPPDNRKYRLIINPFFSPTVLQQHETWIRALAAEVIDPLLASDGFDFSSDLGIPLTRSIILRIMGIADAPEELNQWSDDLIFQQGDPAQAAGNLMGFLADEVRKRQASPGTDFMSGLLTGTFDERHLDEDEMTRISLLVLLAGLETTNSAMSSSVVYLVDHPETRKQLLDNPDVWDIAMDEFVRWSSPATSNARTAVKDADMAGCPVHAGDKILLVWASANRDGREFENPDEIVLDRFPNRHVGFGIGPHRCVGSHLGKLVMRVVFEKVVPALDYFTIEDPAALHWEGAEVRGLRAVPLVRVRAS